MIKFFGNVGAIACGWGFLVTTLFVLFDLRNWPAFDEATTQAARAQITIWYYAVLFTAAVFTGGIAALIRASKD